MSQSVVNTVLQAVENCQRTSGKDAKDQVAQSVKDISTLYRLDSVTKERLERVLTDAAEGPAVKTPKPGTGGVQLEPTPGVDTTMEENAKRYATTSTGKTPGEPGAAAPEVTGETITTAAAAREQAAKDAGKQPDGSDKPAPASKQRPAAQAKPAANKGARRR